jgi:WD40 repeat protein
VRVWDLSTGETLKVLEGHTESVRSVVFSSDGRRIVSGSLDKSVRVSSAGETLKVLEGHTDSARSVAFSTETPFRVQARSLMEL